MRSALLLLPFVLAACPKPRANGVDAGPAPIASSSASASASVAVGPPAPEPASNEAPLEVTMPKRTDVPATIADGKTLVVEGILGAAGERDAPESISCDSPVRLDRPLKVVDEHGEVLKDGRGTGAHPTIGHATRICLWSWKGWKTNGGWMIPWGSHVVVRGTLWPPMTGMHPRALLMFDTEVLEATPEPKAIPAGKMPDGDTVAYIRGYDSGAGIVQLDIAFLYYGAAAQKLARDRADSLPANQFWFILNDSTQLRPWKLPPLAPGVEWPSRIEPSTGGGSGWRTLRETDFVSDIPYLVTIEKGQLKSFRQLSFEAR